MEGNQNEFLEGDETFINEVEGQYPEDGSFEDFPEEDFDLGGSEPKPLGGIYALFDTVLNKPKSTKVSNISREELGDLGISVRDCMRIALLGKTFGHQKFANFFMHQSGIISDSAMSKDGWFTELFVTSKKYASRESSSNVKTLPQQSKSKWKMFSAKEHGNQSQ